MIKFRAWDKETKTMNGMAEIYRNRNQEIELHPRDENIILMQTTGLFDENGKEIFEGDVLELYDCGETIGNVKVYWDGSLGAFMLDAIVVDGREPMYKVLDDEDFSYSVIGNIHENPELLENKE